jgi:CHAD domain-containing protein
MNANGTRRLRAMAQELEHAARRAQRRGRREDWHRLRTTSRKLRGALVAFAGSLDGSAQVDLVRRAKRITRLPAKVRDLDVALLNLELLTRHAASKAEREAVADMVRHLSRKRAQRDGKLRRKLRREQPVQALARRLRRAVRRAATPGRNAPASNAALVLCARAVLDRWAQLGAWQDAEKLHALRVAAKKYRDALTAWTEGQPQAASHRATLEVLQELVDVVGEYHDWSELCGRLERRRSALARKGARPSELSRYQKLLGRARHQQKASHAEYRARFHGRLPELVSSSAAPLAPEPPVGSHDAESAPLN